MFFINHEGHEEKTLFILFLVEFNGVVSFGVGFLVG